MPAFVLLFVYRNMVDLLKHRGPVKLIDGNTVLNQFHPFLCVGRSTFLILRLPPDFRSFLFRLVAFPLIIGTHFLEQAARNVARDVFPKQPYAGILYKRNAISYVAQDFFLRLCLPGESQQPVEQLPLIFDRYFRVILDVGQNDAFQ